MKYQLLNGWTPHSVFYGATSSWHNAVPGLWYRIEHGYVLDLKQPFSKRAYDRLHKFSTKFDNKHEALARWLVANTEGDW